MVAENSTKTFSVTLRVWRQAGPNETGTFKEYPARNLNPNMSFLERAGNKIQTSLNNMEAE